MKKYLLAIALVPLSLNIVAQDLTPGIDLSASVSVWQPDISGDLGVTSTDLGDLGFDDDDVNALSIKLEHPIPLIPNVRLEYASLDASGLGTLDSNFIFDGEVYPGGEVLNTDISLEYIDATLYYQILMVDWGLTFRQIDASVEVDPTSVGLSASEESVDEVLPLVYVQARVPLPTTGFYVAGNMNAISYSDGELVDYRLAAGYELELSVIASFDFELGYRNFTLDVDDGEELGGKVELDGAYFRLGVNF